MWTGFLQVDFKYPSVFFRDIMAVASLLKRFFRELPDPLFPRNQYQDFIKAAKIKDDVLRRDALHAEVNRLPDPNYATLRSLVFHLHKVQLHKDKNRMTAGNLAICFG